MSINGFFKTRLKPALILSILFIAFPNQIFPQTAQPNLHIQSQAAVLMDSLSGQILYEQDQKRKIAPASLAKILTLYLAFDALRAGQIKMDDLVTVSRKAWETGGSKMFVREGERVKVEDLMKGIAIVSANNACVVMAEHLAGTEEAFVAKMNEKARLIGLKESQFKNSHGMPTQDQYTTAIDIALLARSYIENHPEALAFHSATEFGYNGVLQQNRNTLLRKGIGVDGLMTGYTEESGYHLMATAKRENRRMIAVAMGCKKINQRTIEAQKLLEYGFKNFSTLLAVKKSDLFGPQKVSKGKLSQVDLIPVEEGWVTVAKGKENSISITPEIPKSITAPVQKGQIVGKVVIQSEGRPLKEIALLSSVDVPKGIYLFWPLIGGAILFLILAGMILWLSRRAKRKRP